MHARNGTMAFSEAGPTSRAFNVLAAFHTIILPQEDGNCLFERTSHLCQHGWCETFIYSHHTNESRTFSSYSSSLLSPDRYIYYWLVITHEDPPRLIQQTALYPAALHNTMEELNTEETKRGDGDLGIHVVFAKVQNSQI